MFTWRKMIHQTVVLIGIILGAFVSAFSIQAFIIHARLGGGGIGGLALLLYYSFGFPVSLVTLLLNIPLFILGWREINKRFIFRTLVGLGSFVYFLSILKGIKPLPFEDIFLGALYGGVIGGIGGGIVFRLGGSLGGTDIIAKVLQRRLGWGPGTSQLIFNIFIILASWAILGPKVALYTLVSMFTYSRSLDMILSGVPAKAVTIISAKADELTKHITRDLGRGATLLNGKGAYSENVKEIIICVVNLTEIGRLKQVVRETDAAAFMIIQNANEVLGEGFLKND